MVYKLLFIFCCCLWINTSSLSQSKQNNVEKLKEGYYLVVGAYAKNKKQLAENYAQQIKKKGHEASVDFFPKKNYYFVYLKYYEDFNVSIRGLYQYRKIDDFPDCWVYVMHQSEVIDKARDKQISSLNDMFASRFNTSGEETNDSISVKNIEEGSLNNKEVEQEKIVLESNIALSETQNEDNKTSTEVDKDEDEKKIVPLYISLFDARTHIDINGEIDIIDGVNLSKLGSVNSNELLKIEDPGNGTGNLIFISNVFGFKRKQLEFNYYEPLDNEEMDYVTNIGDTIIINFELQQYSKGEFMVMHNVYFFKDAVIMKSVSKYELNQLLSMMKENEKMKIRIHGHTNGNAPGVIKLFDTESKNYFNLNSVSKETTGSAKKLSGLRAEIIQQYLIDNGIESTRMETKAWGGKSMIYDKHDKQAKQNVRVEIEILSK
ncbi:MAG: OmpA family protein [Cyclobacteriaceae bacterium]|nr:OmpA family protein [Cyclobacteriaceae bacterium]